MSLSLLSPTDDLEEAMAIVEKCRAANADRLARHRFRKHRLLVERYAQPRI